MKKLFKLLMVAIIALSLVACSSNGGNSGNNEGGNGGSDAAASNELTIYSPNSEGEVNNIIPAFEAKYGIKVNLISDGTGNVLSRIQAEADNPQCDVMWGGMNYNTYVQYPDLWEEYVSPLDSTITDPNNKNFTGYFTSYGLSGNSPFVLNTTELEKLGLTADDITGYQSLIDHADVLKGHVAMCDPEKSSSAWAQLKCMVYLFGEGAEGDYENRDYTKSWEYVEKFVDLIDGVALAKSSEVYKYTADGEYAVGVTYEDPAIQLLEDGATNIAVVYPEEGSNWTPCAASIVKGAPNMENAKLFVDFLISEEGQKIYAGTTLRTVTIDSLSQYMPPMSEIQNVWVEDLTYTAKHKQEWIDHWKAIVEAYNAAKN